MLSVSGGTIWYDKGEGKPPVSLGPDTALIAAPAELTTLGERDGVLHMATPHNIDLIFAVGDRVAGVESKKCADIVGSHQAGRLGRQIAVLLEHVDIPILMRRGTDMGVLVQLVADAEHHAKRWSGRDMWSDIHIRYPQLGVYVVDVPDVDLSVKMWLKVYRAALLTVPERAVIRREKGPKERQPGWLLRRVPKVGPTRSAALIEEYGSTGAVLDAVRNGGVSPPSVQKVLKEALK